MKKEGSEESERSARSSKLIIPLATTLIVMLVGMSIFQIVKFYLVPHYSLVKSNIITVFFSSTVATVAAYLVLRKRQILFDKIVTEVAERRRAEKEVKQLNEELQYHISQLESTNRELEAFSYSVSHDLRAPLRHIIGYVEMLQKNAKPGLDENSFRYLTTISDSAKRLGNLIDDLLAFSRIGRMEMRMITFNLNQLIDETLNELMPETGNREIEWRIMQLPDMHGDRALLKLVFVNLISNAIKFTSPRPRAIIEIGFAPVADKDITVFCKDNGVGFDMKYRDKLFGVFQRLHSAQEFEGTGIGLANVQRIVHRHGGKTWAEGFVDGGATFYFSIPNLGRAVNK